MLQLVVTRTVRTLFGSLPKHALLQLAAPIEFFHKPPGIAPARFSFHVKFKEELGPEHALDLHARRRTDLLQHAAALADQNSLLSIALAIDGGCDARQTLPFLEVFDNHCRGV